MRIPRLPIAVLLCWSALAAGRAHATDNFPRALAQDLAAGLDGGVPEPRCDLCHLGDVRTYYSVNTLFGKAMHDRGMVARDEDALRRALAAMEADEVDSDGDGVIDVMELRMGTDPNVPGPDPGPRPIGYGCGSQVAPGRASGSAIAMLGLVLAFLWIRRPWRRGVTHVGTGGASKASPARSAEG